MNIIKMLNSKNGKKMNDKKIQIWITKNESKLKKTIINSFSNIAKIKEFDIEKKQNNFADEKTKPDLIIFLPVEKTEKDYQDLVPKINDWILKSKADFFIIANKAISDFWKYEIVEFASNEHHNNLLLLKSSVILKTNFRIMLNQQGYSKFIGKNDTLLFKSLFKDIYTSFFLAFKKFKENTEPSFSKEPPLDFCSNCNYKILNYDDWINFHSQHLIFCGEHCYKKHWQKTKKALKERV